MYTCDNCGRKYEIVCACFDEQDFSQSKDASSTWSCSACTFLNLNSDAQCLVCGEYRNHHRFTSPPVDASPNRGDEPRFVDILTGNQNIVSGAHDFGQQPSESASDWACTSCTLFNAPQATHCKVCHAANPNLGSIEAQHLSEDQEWHRLRMRYGLEAKEHQGANYVEQFEIQLQRKRAKNKISEKDEQAMRSKIVTQGPELFFSAGFVVAIREYYNRVKAFQKNLAFGLISGSCQFYSNQLGDKGWGCGYRNIQTIYSWLLHAKDTHHHLAKILPTKYVPALPELQMMIEKAWSLGWDPEGAQQLGGTLVSSKKCIGTTEFVSLFRSFGIRCRVVQFQSKRKPKEMQQVEQQLQLQQKKKGKQPPLYFPNQNLFQFVRAYFIGTHQTANSNSNSNCQETLSSKPNAPKSTNSSQASNSSKSAACIPPLFLQHDGHSRAIVGYEERQTNGSILFFDPGQDEAALQKGLFQKNPQIKNFKKSLDTFTKPQYQLVILEPENPMTPEESQKSKIIDSENK